MNHPSSDRARVPSRRTFLAASIAIAAGVSAVLPGRPARAATPVLGDRGIGAPDAKVVVVEYASMTCPHCADFHAQVLPGLKERYIEPGKVRLLYRDFPLDQLALRAAMLARCAGPERYFTFVGAIYSDQKRWARASDPVVALKQMLKLGGLSEEAMNACLADKALEDAILQERLDGQAKHQINGTPSFVIDGRTYSSHEDLEAFQKIIDPLLEAAG